MKSVWPDPSGSLGSLFQAPQHSRQSKQQQLWLPVSYLGLDSISQIFKQGCEGKLPSCTIQNKYLIVFVATQCVVLWGLKNYSVIVTGMWQWWLFFFFWSTFVTCSKILRKDCRKTFRNVLNGFRKLVNPVWTFIRFSHTHPFDIRTRKALFITACVKSQKGFLKEFKWKICPKEIASIK